MRNYTLNQIKRFVNEYRKHYDHVLAAMNTEIHVEDCDQLILTPQFVELLNNPVRTSGQQPYERIAEIKYELCNWVSNGKTLADFCRQDNVPKPATLYRWLEEDKDFERAFARARQYGHDVIAMQCLHIADTTHEETIREMTEEDSTANGFKSKEKITRKDAFNHRKLRIETRLKLLAKWDPKRYGELLRQEVSGQDGAPIETKDVTDPEALARKMAFLLSKGSKS